MIYLKHPTTLPISKEKRPIKSYSELSCSFVPVPIDTMSGTASPPMEGEKVNTHIVTLTRFLTEEQVKHKEATGDFT